MPQIFQTERNLRIVALHVLEEKSFSEIAQKEGMRKSNAHRIYQLTRERILDGTLKLSSEGYPLLKALKRGREEYNESTSKERHGTHAT